MLNDFLLRAKVNQTFEEDVDCFLEPLLKFLISMNLEHFGNYFWLQSSQRRIEGVDS